LATKEIGNFLFFEKKSTNLGNQLFIYLFILFLKSWYKYVLEANGHQCVLMFGLRLAT